MPRVYSAGKVEAGRIADGDVLNANYKICLETLNGQLDAHNVPMQGFDQRSLVDSAPFTTSLRTRAVGTVNSYYTATGRGAYVEYASTTDSAWHSVVIDTGEYLEVFVNEPACVVVGATQVSGERVANTDATTSARFGEESTWEIGVFVDGNLIAETGEMPSGIYTLHLPFSVQLGAGTHTIETRWKQNLRPISAINTHRNFWTRSAHMWVRCQKR